MAANNILLVAHVNPDGDALSALSAFLEVLKKSGRKVSAYAEGQFSDSFFFLPYSSEIIANKEQIVLSDFDTLVILDCGSINRTNLAPEIFKQRSSLFIIEFDHHPKIDNHADLEFRYSDAASTTEILYHFFKHNKVLFSRNLANAILTGIITDTGNFLYPSTSDDTVSIAGEMLNYGASFPKIFQKTYQNKSLRTMKLWGAAMENLVINEKYNLAYSVLTHQDIAANKDEDDEDIFGNLVGFLSNLGGVKMVMLIREEKLGEIRCSLRSSDPSADVSRLALFLGGGGHKKAAAFSMSGSLVKINNVWQIV